MFCLEFAKSFRCNIQSRSNRFPSARHHAPLLFWRALRLGVCADNAKARDVAGFESVLCFPSLQRARQMAGSGGVLGLLSRSRRG